MEKSILNLDNFVEHQRDAIIHQRTEGQFCPIIVGFPTGTGYNQFCASLNRLSSGKLIVIYDCQYQLGQRCSTDGGETWPELKIIDNPGRVTDVAGGITPSGRLVIFYARGETEPESRTEHGFIYSGDEGETWSDYQSLVGENPISGTWDYNRPYGRMIEIADGRLMQGIWCWQDNPPSYNTYVLFSDDNGLTWGDAVIVHQATNDREETYFLYLGGRKILAVNTAGLPDTEGVRQYLSDDSGQTWDEVGIIPIAGVVRTPILIGQRISGSELVIVMYYTIPVGDPSVGPLYRCWAYASEIIDSVNNWRDTETVLDDIYAYPTAININEGITVLGLIPHRPPGNHKVLREFLDQRRLM